MTSWSAVETKGFRRGLQGGVVGPKQEVAPQVAPAVVDTVTMQINGLRGADPVMSRMADLLNRADATESSWGPLTSSDLKLLKGATGQDFNWPPKEGEGAPAAAFDLALKRMDERARNLPWNKIGSAELAKLKQAGDVTEAFADAAEEYLRTDKSTNGVGPEVPAANVATTDTARRAQPVQPPQTTTTPWVQDGKLYL